MESNPKSALKTYLAIYLHVSRDEADEGKNNKHCSQRDFFIAAKTLLEFSLKLHTRRWAEARSINQAQRLVSIPIQARGAKAEPGGSCTMQYYLSIFIIQEG